MQQINIQYLKTAVGELILGSYHAQLCLCDWRYRKNRAGIDARIQNSLGASYHAGSDDIIEQARDQLTDYFSQRRKSFAVPLRLVGSEFQQQVWRGLLGIPYGATLSYLQLARELGRSNAVRAVANANGANALSIFIPCHRVIGSDGQLTGYAGGIAAKQKLLDLESDLFAAQ